MPSPSQLGQAPNGLLKEKSRGSISSMVKPETGQAKRAEKVTRSAAVLPVSAFSAKSSPSERLQTRLDGIRQPRLQPGPDDHPVDHHLDIVLQLLVEGRRLLDLVELAVDLDPLEAALLQLGQLLAVFALAPAHDGGQQIEPGSLGHGHDAVDHLADGLALDGQAGRRRIGDADAGEEQAHIVVDLGHRADGRARVLRGGLLLDGDGRRQALDGIDVRLLHQLQELAGIGREGFDIAALALGIDGVEGEGGLAGTRQAGDHHQLVARHVDIDVLQIMLARPADRDPGTLEFACHDPLPRLGSAVAGLPWVLSGFAEAPMRTRRRIGYASRPQI